MGVAAVRPERGLPGSSGAARDGVVRHLGADDRSSTRVRLVDGALRCLARQGIAKTTVDDIAREAGFSRATAYRAFPGGRDDILAAVVETEVARLFSSLAVAMGEAHDIEDVLVAGMVESARQLRSHEALSYLLAHEPGAVLPHLTFAGQDRVLLVAGDLAAPFFARWLEPEQASRAAEWAVRIVLAYCSDQTQATDLTDPAATRALVRSFVLPGILALRVEAGGGGSTDLSSSPRSSKRSTHAKQAMTTTTKGTVQ